MTEHPSTDLPAAALPPAPNPTETSADSGLEGAPVVAAAPAKPRAPLLAGMLEDHFAGRRRWRLVDRILTLAGGGERLTEGELVAAVDVPGCVGVVRALLKRGALVECQHKMRRVVVRAGQA